MLNLVTRDCLPITSTNWSLPEPPRIALTCERCCVNGCFDTLDDPSAHCEADDELVGDVGILSSNDGWMRLYDGSGGTATTAPSRCGDAVVFAPDETLLGGFYRAAYRGSANWHEVRQPSWDWTTTIVGTTLPFTVKTRGDLDQTVALLTNYASHFYGPVVLRRALEDTIRAHRFDLSGRLLDTAERTRALCPAPPDPATRDSTLPPLFELALEHDAPATIVEAYTRACGGQTNPALLLHAALERDRTEAIAGLRAAGARPSRADLRAAIERGDTKRVRMLVDLDVDTGSSWTEDDLPMNVARRLGNPAMLELLEELRLPETCNALATTREPYLAGHAGEWRVEAGAVVTVRVAMGDWLLVGDKEEWSDRWRWVFADTLRPVLPPTPSFVAGPTPYGTKSSMPDGPHLITGCSAGHFRIRTAGGAAGWIESAPTRREAR